MKYYMIITYPSSGTQVLMNTGKDNNNRAVASDEDNKNLLIGMGQRLLEENVISSYQLVQTVGQEQSQFTQSSCEENLPVL
jgi:hypothetical protein